MLGNNNIYVALPVKDMAKAMRFYGDTLGLTIVDQNKNGVWYQIGQSRVAIYPSDFAGSNLATAAIWEVADPALMVDQLRARGVEFERYDELPGAKRQGDIHKFGDFVAAWIKDPDGNLICLSHHL